MAGCLLCSSLLLLLRSSLSSVSPANLTTLAAAYSSSYSSPYSSSSPSSSSARPLRLRVMTYNIKQIPNYLGLHAWDQQRRLNELIDALGDFALPSVTATTAVANATDIPDGGPPTHDSTHSATAPRVSADAPDAIVFNELISASAYNAIRRRLSHVFPYHTNVIGKDCATAEGWTTLTGNCQVYLPRGGVAIISRHPIVEAHGLVYAAKAKGTWDQLCNKGAVLAKIMLPDAKGTGDKKDGVGKATSNASSASHPPVLSEPPRRAVWVMGTHLQADEGSTNGDGIREKQAAEFTSWIDDAVKDGDIKIDSAEEPIIVAGDLNVRFKGKQEDYRKMMDLTKLRVNFTSENAEEGLGSFSALTNWLAKADYFSHSMPLDYDDVLDYIGFRRDFRHPVFAPAQRVLPLKAKEAWFWSYMKGWWNLPQTGWTWNNGYYNDISDHYPLMADFYF